MSTEQIDGFGLIQNTFDPRDVWLDEILGADPAPIPESFRIDGGLVSESQGAFPFCVLYAITTMMEYHYGLAGEEIRLSQQHPFFHCGGTKVGTSFRAGLELARIRGIIRYDACPMPDTRLGWGNNWYETMKPIAMAIPFTNVKKIGGYARVGYSPKLLQQAIMARGPVLIDVQAGKGGYYTGNGVYVPGADRNHAVLLVGWTPTHWIIFDSLDWASKTNGYVTLMRSYEMSAAYVITDLPEGWKKTVEEARAKDFQFALDHYNKPRNIEAEIAFAAEMLKEFKAFNNQSVLEASGRFWTVLINAGVYGGYSLSYVKGGKKLPGDLINDIYNWRRTGQHIFDFNKLRSEHA